MKLERVELRRLRLPLVAPFRTSVGTSTEREVLLVRVDTPDAAGWGECVADAEPTYSAEYADSAQHVLRHHLLPRLAAAQADGRTELTYRDDVAARLMGYGWNVERVGDANDLELFSRALEKFKQQEAARYTEGRLINELLADP